MKKTIYLKFLLAALFFIGWGPIGAETAFGGDQPVVEPGKAKNEQNRTTYRCSYCKQTFSSAVSVKNHIKECPSNPSNSKL